MKNPFWQAFSVLYRYPAFGRLWIGRSISLLGDALTLIALPWFVLQVTASATATAGILLALQLPAILTSTVIGSLIDTFQPRTIVTIDNGLRTLIVGLIPLLYWLGLLELWLLFLLTILAGMLVPATEVGSRSLNPIWSRIRIWRPPICSGHSASTSPWYWVRRRPGYSWLRSEVHPCC